MSIFNILLILLVFVIVFGVLSCHILIVSYKLDKDLSRVINNAKHYLEEVSESKIQSEHFI